MVSPWLDNGTLVDYVRSERYKPEEDCRRLVSDALYGIISVLTTYYGIQLCEISSGLAYLHSLKVVHGDIHPVCLGQMSLSYY
jgi:serine/threonine protein kinase